MEILIGVLEEGLIYAVIALGIYITYKILDFPDLSVDGTFPLGGAVTAALLSVKVIPVLALLFSFICGALAGIVTGLIHVKTESTRSFVRHHHHDRTLFRKLKNSRKAMVPLFRRTTVFKRDRDYARAGRPETVHDGDHQLVIVLVR